MNRISLRTIALCLVLIAGSCVTQTFALNKPFDLGVGESLRLSESDFSIKLVAVENESRCPTGAVCIWQGNAAAIFEVAKGGASQAITLYTDTGRQDMPNEATIHGRKIRLVELAPYPRQGVRIGKDAYVATLFIS